MLAQDNAVSSHKLLQTVVVLIHGSEQRGHVEVTHVAGILSIVAIRIA